MAEFSAKFNNKRWKYQNNNACWQYGDRVSVRSFPFVQYNAPDIADCYIQRHKNTPSVNCHPFGKFAWTHPEKMELKEPEYAGKECESKIIQKYTPRRSEIITPGFIPDI